MGGSYIINTWSDKKRGQEQKRSSCLTCLIDLASSGVKADQCVDLPGTSSPYAGITVSNLSILRLPWSPPLYFLASFFRLPDSFLSAMLRLLLPCYALSTMHRISIVEPYCQSGRIKCYLVSNGDGFAD